jgi:hypothetical protein
MIFSNTHRQGSSLLLDGVKKILGGIDSCIATTKNINSFRLNPDNQKGLNCLTTMHNEIEKIELTSGKTFRR